MRLRNFINSVLPAQPNLPLCEAVVRACYPSTEEHVGAEVKPAAEPAASAQTAQAMADDLASPPTARHTEGGQAYGLPPTDAKASMDKLFPPPAAAPADAAAPGDEEVPLPEDETPAPLNDADKSDELVASITALIKRFVARDSGHWAYTGDIFHDRKTTESEVVLGKITDVAVLRGIHADLEAAWAKLTAPPPPKKPKKTTPGPSGRR